LAWHATNYSTNNNALSWTCDKVESKKEKKKEIEKMEEKEQNNRIKLQMQGTLFVVQFVT